jgi:NhaA family Na+:H+ antiporter
LLWANLLPESYFTFAHAASFPVNQIAMVFFFGLVAQELFEEFMPGGALRHWRRWPVPIVAAVGGVAGAALVYGAWINAKWTPVLFDGWPIVAGVDLAFAYFLVRAIFPRHPAVPFVLLLAIASNIIGFVAIAPSFLGSATRVGGTAVLMAAAIGVAAWLRRRHVRRFWPYVLIAGGMSWCALYLEGFHPALALVPIVPFMPHTRRRLDELLFDEPDAHGQKPRHYEHVWHYYVQVALFLFGLVNAGVMLNGYGEGTTATLLGSFVGRSLGILGAVAVTVALGFHLPAHLGWREVTVVALTASIGFTFTLFFATALYPAGPTLAQLKLGAVLTSGAIPLVLGVARLLAVGRFHGRRPPAVNRVT